MPPPGARSAGWDGSVLGPTTASYSASSLGTSWRPTRTLPTPRPSDSTRCRWVGPRIPTNGVTTIPNCTVVSCPWSPCRDRLRSRPGGTTSKRRLRCMVLQPVQAPHSAAKIGFRLSPSAAQASQAAIARSAQPSRCSRSVRRLLKRRRAVIRQGRSSVVHQPRWSSRTSCGALRHPVLAMADRSIDQGLAKAHARRSVRRRLA